MPQFPERTELTDNYPNPDVSVFKGGIGKLWDAITGLLGTSGAAADARKALGAASVGSITEADLTMDTGKIVGRKTAEAGAVELLSLSEVLDLVGGAEQGAILFRGSAGWQRLAAGAAGQVLVTGGEGGDPGWGSLPSGGVSSVNGRSGAVTIVISDLTGIDGAGSGLDADLLDGYHATNLPYAPSTGGNYVPKDVGANGVGLNSTMSWVGGGGVASGSTTSGAALTYPNGSGASGSWKNVTLGYVGTGQQGTFQRIS
jgi:hypothetical protein